MYSWPANNCPIDLRARLVDHYASQLAVQRAALPGIRTQLQSSDEAAEVTRETGDYFNVLDALLAEFEAEKPPLRCGELGIEPVARSVFYGIGILPAVRVEIADAARLNAMLDRVEVRSGLSVAHGQLGEQAYRRIGNGGVDLVLSVTPTRTIGRPVDRRAVRSSPAAAAGPAGAAQSLAASGEIEGLISRHGFTGYGEGLGRLMT